MTNSTKLGAFCDKVLEICWLLAVVITPLFFNTASNNVFERDKWTTLRTVALIMATVWVVRFVEQKLSGERGVQFTWRTPLVLPILFTVLSYLISTFLSLTFRVSVFGGYQRMRGAFSTLSCIVICLIILDRMRTRAQAERFISIVILNSLPIALYGFIQRNELDPLPWGGDVTRRIASNMGNPIFVAAYMIMAALPTLSRIVNGFRSILTDDETGTADVLRAAAYIFMFLVQVISIWYSGSRGPLMGLVAGLGLWGLLGLLALQQAAQRERPFAPRDLWRDLGLGTAFGLGSLAAAGGIAAGLFFASRAILAEGSESSQWIAAGGALLTLFATWMAFIITRRGWRWLWSSALVLGLLLATGFFLVNTVFNDWSRQQPWLGRFDDVLQAGGGTGMVRNLIWQGSYEMIQLHEPIEEPPTMDNPAEWRPDRLNALRPFVGHGPESMYVAYNRFYPPLLGHYESRTATPDRAHNATIDRFVTTGLIGVAAYLWIFGAIFYYGLHWLGLLPGDWRRIVFFSLLVAGAIAAVVAVSLIPSLGPHFFGLAIPAGMMAGVFLYLIVYSFSLYWESAPLPAPHPHALLLTGLLGAVAAHFIEINFGIVIASTLTTFWAYTGILAVAGTEKLADGRAAQSERASGGVSKTRKRRRRRRRATHTRSLPGWVGPTLAVSIVGGFILGTLAFDFTIAPAPEDPYYSALWQEIQQRQTDQQLAQLELYQTLDDPLTIIRRTLTVLSKRNMQTCTASWNMARSECVSYGILMIFGFTWVMSAVVLIAQMAKRGAFRERPDDWIQATGLYLLISLSVGFGFALVLASHHASRWRPGAITSMDDLADYVIAPMTQYYVYIILTAVAGGAVFLLGTRRKPSQTAHSWGIVTLVVLTILMGYTAVRVNLYPIQADVVYKLALSLESNKDYLDEALAMYDMAIGMTPKEDFFYFEKGRVLLSNSMTAEGIDTVKMDSAIQAFLDAHDIAPLNTDHVKGLAKAHQASASAAPDETTYEQRLQLAETYYDIATSLSPRNAFLWNEWVGFYLATNDLEGAQEVISQSLAVDDAYDRTWQLQAEVYSRSGRTAEFAQAYERIVEIKPKNAGAWQALGNTYNSLGEFTEAISACNQAVELQPSLVNGWVCLGDAYRNLENWPEAEWAYIQATTQDPANFAALYALGNYVYPKLGRMEDAVSALENLAPSAPANRAWEVNYALAMANAQLDRNDEAMRYAQTALELAPDEHREEIEAFLENLPSTPEQD